MWITRSQRAAIHRDSLTILEQQAADLDRSARSRSRILQATISLYREIGYGKTTVADIARRCAMSPANVYRFFRSKRDIEDAVVAGLLEQARRPRMSAAAADRRSSGWRPSSARYRGCMRAGFRVTTGFTTSLQWRPMPAGRLWCTMSIVLSACWRRSSRPARCAAISAMAARRRWRAACLQR